ncbi:hypothetical protein FIBSPDRAFT_1052483 [Athelia psychrophila]|uniref:Uncharacterized protein n=1 Tax=Athelia psychrophila TaxID=1759441 RepID=A0A165X8Z8_9AGAM|nr:hypothetical protein FIBSPDRAFT_1052483 [Fibularhizoctonia sp. CBS 109695]
MDIIYVRDASRADVRSVPPTKALVVVRLGVFVSDLTLNKTPTTTWSFGHIRLPDSLARLNGGPLPSLMPTQNTCRWPFTLPRAMLHECLVLALYGIEGTSHTPMSVPDGAGDAGGSDGLQMSASRDTWEPLEAHLSEDWRRVDDSPLLNHSLCIDIDAQSLAHARANIAQNDLQGRITFVAADPKGRGFGPLESKHDAPFDFTMCNPTFYSSEEDIAQFSTAKVMGPNVVCTSAAVEMIISGEEAAFVVRMVPALAIIVTMSAVSLLQRLAGIESQSLSQFPLTTFLTLIHRASALKRDISLPQTLGTSIDCAPPVLPQSARVPSRGPLTTTATP